MEGQNPCPPSCPSIQALTRVEESLRRELSAHEKLDDQRFSEHERRLGDLNQSHKAAVEAKRLTDDAATRVQERSATKEDLQDFKDMVNKTLDIQAGASAARAAMLSVGISVVALAINVAFNLLK